MDRHRITCKTAGWDVMHAITAAGFLSAPENHCISTLQAITPFILPIPKNLFDLIQGKLAPGLPYFELSIFQPLYAYPALHNCISLHVKKPKNCKNTKQSQTLG
jgi:hypothetical protein